MLHLLGQQHRQRQGEDLPDDHVHHGVLDGHHQRVQELLVLGEHLDEVVEADELGRFEQLVVGEAEERRGQHGPERPEDEAQHHRRDEGIADDGPAPERGVTPTRVADGFANALVCGWPGR
jgi:hypothetical protein